MVCSAPSCLRIYHLTRYNLVRSLKESKMRGIMNNIFFFASFLLFLILTINPGVAEMLQKDIDETVRIFFENHRGRWTDWNVPEADGKVLYDLIIKNKYKRAVEIGKPLKKALTE